MESISRRWFAKAPDVARFEPKPTVCSCGCCQRWEPLARCVLTTLRIAQRRIKNYRGTSEEIPLVIAEIERALGQ